MSPISVVDFGVVIGMSTCKKPWSSKLECFVIYLLTFICMTLYYLAFSTGLEIVLGLWSRTVAVWWSALFDTPSLVVHSDVPKFDGVVMFPPKTWWFYKKNRKKEKNVFLIRNSLTLTSATMNLYKRKILKKVNSIKIKYTSLLW